MPTYDYACATCGGFDALRRTSERDAPCPCPGCGAAAPRVFAFAPQLAVMDGVKRRAMQVNERARHEPRRSSDEPRLRHAAGCGCCSTSPSARRGGTLTAADGSKAFPAKRPWMISH